MADLVAEGEFVGVEEDEAEVGEGAGVGGDVGGLGVGGVVVEDGEEFLILEGLAGEFLDQRAGDFGGVGAFVRGEVGVVALHFLDVGEGFFALDVGGVAVEDEVEGALDLFGKGCCFFFESKGEGDGAIGDEVAVEEGEGLR